MPEPTDDTRTAVRPGADPAPADHEAAVDAAIAEYLRAAQGSDPFDVDGWLARHPDAADELAEFLRDEGVFARLASPLLAAPAGTESFHPETDSTLTLGGDSAGSAPGPRLDGLDDYELLGEVARGGMGVVYRALQKSLGRVVALKVIRAGEFADPDEVRRFRAEAEAAATLDHPNIVPVYEVGEHGGVQFYAMRLVEGGSLAARMGEWTAAKAPSRAEARRRQAAAARLVAAVARAVHHAHQRGVLHRDLKPGNILIDADGQPHVTDFGLARRIGKDSTLTRTGAILGTPSYMAPEQARGREDVTTEADVYGLGAVLYELLAGRPPFAGEDVLDTLYQVREREPASPRSHCPWVDRDPETVCLKCLEKDPSRRYSSAAALADDLERWLAGEPILARRAGPLERAAKWVRRNPAGAGLVALGGVAAAAVIWGLVALSYNAELKEGKRRLEVANGELTAEKEEAERLRKAAEEQRAIAEGQRRRAAGQEALARRYLYVARLTQARQAELENQPGRVLELLRSVIPEEPGQEDLRGFEWYHLWRQHHGEESRLSGHTAAVLAVAVSRDGHLIASGGADRMLCLWDFATGHARHSLAGHAGQINAVAFSRDSKFVASGSADGTARVWDTASGKEVLVLRGHEAAVTAVTFAPDGRSLVSGSEDRTARVWRLDTGEAVVVFRSHKAAVSGVSFSPDGGKVASVSRPPNSTANPGVSDYVWDPRTGKELWKIPRDAARTGVAFSPDGARLALAEVRVLGQARSSSRLAVWPVGSPDVRLWDEQERFIAAVAWTPDGKELVTASEDRTARVWDAESGKPRFTFHEQVPVNCVAPSPDGSRLVIGSDDRLVKVLSPPGRAVGRVSAEAGRPITVAFTPDGSRLLTHSAGAFVSWDVAGRKELTRWPAALPNYGRFALSPDGRLLALGKGWEVWDASTGQVAVRAAPQPPVINAIGTAFSPDGALVAAGPIFRTDEVGVWETATGRLSHRFSPSPPNNPISLAFLPGGRRLLVGTIQNSGQPLAPGGGLLVWDLPAGRLLRTVHLSRYGAPCVAVSPDGRRFAAAFGSFRNNRSGGEPSEVRVWDTATLDEVAILHGHQDCVWSLSFSPDGRRLASAAGADNSRGPGEVKLWDLATGQEVWGVGLPQAVYSVAFSPDGRTLAAARADGRVELYDGSPLIEQPIYHPLPENR